MTTKEKPAPAATGGGLENNQTDGSLAQHIGRTQDAILIARDGHLVGFAVARRDGCYDALDRSARHIGRCNTLHAAVILLMEACRA